MFHNYTRTHFDAVNVTETDTVNLKTLNYNLYKNSFPTQTINNTALSQPDINYFTNTHISQNIDVSSKLLHDKSRLTIDHSRYSIQEPVFNNKPYKGRGEVDSLLESQLKKGETYRDKKYFTRLNEQPAKVYKDVPLLPNVSKSLANPTNFVEQSKHANWVPGGLPTRDLVKE